MEHKLIQGGEQYLPFARSRIKALRATGLNYATQKFVFPDGEVAIRLVGQHEYINLSGGEPAVLSGVVRGSSAVGQALRDFKPTEQARKMATVKTDPLFPAVFSDEPKLKVAPALHLTGDELGTPNEYDFVLPDDLQYRHISASMYSGLMAKAVQFLMGRGRKPFAPVRKDSDGNRYVMDKQYEKLVITGAALTEAQSITQVLYDFRWQRCHGIVLGSDGHFWLVEIGSVNGVIAMPLPFFNKTNYTHSKRDVIKETYLVFKGLPSGATFPADIHIADAIASGDVIRLATASEMDPFFSKEAFSSYMGWSFNTGSITPPVASVAHNTCHYASGANRKGAHYKLEFFIGALVVDRAVNQPVASGYATLSLVSEGFLTNKQTGLSVRKNQFTFYDGDFPPTYMRETPGRTIADGNPDEISDAPIFVCHINNTLNIVQAKVAAYSNTTTGTTPPTVLPASVTLGQTWTEAISGRSAGRFIDSPALPEAQQRSRSDTTWEVVLLDVVDFPPPPTPNQTTHIIFEKSFLSANEKLNTWASWPEGCRDGYAVSVGGISSSTIVGYYRLTHVDGIFDAGAFDSGPPATDTFEIPQPSAPSVYHVFYLTSISGTTPVGVKFTCPDGTVIDTSADPAMVGLYAGELLNLRHSMLSETQQSIYSTPEGIKGVGDLVATETPASPKYSFIGYT